MIPISNSCLRCLVAIVVLGFMADALAQSEPTTPGSLTAAAVSGTRIDLSWSASTDDAAVLSYVVERCAGASCTDFDEIFQGAWTHCAGENEWCSFSGMRTVRYGAGTTWLQQQHTDGVSCSNGVFTDPIWGVEKICQLSSVIPTQSELTTTFVDTGLTAGMTYRYRVRARDAVPSYSDYSSIVSATTSTGDTQAPTTPSDLDAIAVSSAQINLTWSASTDNVEVTGYSLERCEGAACTDFEEIATPTATSFNSSGLTAGTTFRYRVRARDAVPNYSSFSTVVSATTQTAGIDTQPPTVPIGLVATGVSSTQINLSWSASTDNVAVLGYIVERCDGASCTDFEEIFQGAWTHCADENEWCSFSGVRTVRYGAGTTWVHQEHTDGVECSNGVFTDPIWGTPKSCELSSVSPTQSPPATTFADTGLVAGTYRYRVRARDAALNYSDYSSIVAATAQTGGGGDTEAPTTPTGLNAIVVSNTQINLSWTASSDNLGVAGYEIDRCAGVGCASWSLSVAVTGTSYSNTGLAPGTTYQYRVRARDVAGNLSSNSVPISQTTTGTSDTTAPSAPSGISVSVQTVGIVVSWGSATDNSGAIANYEIERCDGTGCSFSSLATVGGLVMSHTDTSAGGGGSYSYRVRARDPSSNTGPYATSLGVTAAFCD